MNAYPPRSLPPFLPPPSSRCLPLLPSDSLIRYGKAGQVFEIERLYARIVKESPDHASERSYYVETVLPLFHSLLSFPLLTPPHLSSSRLPNSKPHVFLVNLMCLPTSSTWRRWCFAISRRKEYVAPLCPLLCLLRSSLFAASFAPSPPLSLFHFSQSLFSLTVALSISVSPSVSLYHLSLTPLSCRQHLPCQDVISALSRIYCLDHVYRTLPPSLPPPSF